MAEPLAAIGDVLAIAILVGLVALLAWALHWAIGPQVFGLPAMIALLVIAAGVTAFSNVGVAALAAVLIGLALVVVVIGMAMNVGAKRAGRAADERRKDDPY
jgi:ribose 1,5-bisphosphokinase PhnN